MSHSNMTIVIPMAGQSKRYFDAGYKLPKYLLPVGKKTMIEQVVDLFSPAEDHYIFIISNLDNKDFGVGDFLQKLPIKKDVYEITPHDFGPTYSLLQIGDKIPADEEIIVNYCDFLMEWPYEKFLEAIRPADCHGAIVSFRGFQPASLGDTYYAYMRVGPHNNLEEIREKQPFTNNRIEEHGSTGTYYYKKWQYVCDFGKQQIEQNLKAGAEFYPTLIYNLMLEAGLKSKIFEAKKFICLGTPHDYREFVYWHHYFKEII